MKIICLLGTVGSGIDSIYGALKRWTDVELIELKMEDVRNKKPASDSNSIYIMEIESVDEFNYMTIVSGYKDNLVPIVLIASPRTRISRLLNLIPDEDLTINDFLNLLEYKESMLEMLTDKEDGSGIYIPKDNWFFNDKSPIGALSSIKRFIIQATREDRIKTKEGD